MRVAHRLIDKAEKGLTETGDTEMEVWPRYGYAATIREATNSFSLQSTSQMALVLICTDDLRKIGARVKHKPLQPATAI